MTEGRKSHDQAAGTAAYIREWLYTIRVTVTSAPWGGTPYTHSWQVVKPNV